MAGRGLAVPKEDVERAASHFGIAPSEVTPQMVEALPSRGTGLERGTARGSLSDEEVDRIASAVVEKAREDVGIRDVIIGSAMGEGAIPLYGRETRKEPCSCCLIEPEGPNAPANRMCTTKSAIGTLKDSEEREWCSEIKIVADGRCTRARSISEAAKECKEKHPEDTEAFFRCYIPAFSQITKGSNPGASEPPKKLEVLKEILATKTVEEAIILRGKYRDVWLSPDDVAAIDRHLSKLKSESNGEYVTITDPGKTTFKVGEIISREAFEKENERVRKLGEKPATGR